MEFDPESAPNLPINLPSLRVPGYEKPSFGQRAAEKVVTVVGSWRFIVIQSLLLSAWVLYNVLPWGPHWDPYPFILMNLVLSLQAAYTAPMIMMAQNREAYKDRYVSKSSYFVSAKTELDVQEIQRLLDSQNRRIDHLINLLAQKSEPKK
jgi:uncharacterized membrane protein